MTGNFEARHLLDWMVDKLSSFSLARAIYAVEMASCSTRGSTSSGVMLCVKLDTNDVLFVSFAAALTDPIANRSLRMLIFPGFSPNFSSPSHRSAELARHPKLNHAQTAHFLSTSIFPHVNHGPSEHFCSSVIREAGVGDIGKQDPLTPSKVVNLEVFPTCASAFP